MFGFHSKDKCPFDIWAPDHRSAVVNTAFSAYAKHTQEIEDVIDTICELAREGYTNFSIDIDDCFSESDLKYIEEEVYRRLE